MELTHFKKVQHRHLTNLHCDYLSKGSKVEEVTSKSQGFVGSWFEATVLKSPKNHMSSLKRTRLTLIDYVSLVNEEGTSLLREKVDAELRRRRRRRRSIWLSLMILSLRWSFAERT